MTRQADAVLNDAFVRLYRSLGHYLDSASLVVDVGEDVLPGIIEQQKADANTLGRMVYERRGFVETDNFPATYTDLHYVKASGLLEFWVQDQKELLAGLESDLQALPVGSEEHQVLSDIVARVRQQLGQLEDLYSKVPQLD